jgi:hypothetical protein
MPFLPASEKAEASCPPLNDQQAQPGPFRQDFETAMQLSPHGFPFRHVLQQAARRTRGPDRILCTCCRRLSETVPSARLIPKVRTGSAAATDEIMIARQARRRIDPIGAPMVARANCA